MPGKRCPNGSKKVIQTGKRCPNGSKKDEKSQLCCQTKKKSVVVKKLKKTVKIKSKMPPKQKTPVKIPFQSKINLLEKYGAVLVKKRGSVITDMVGEKTINNAFELVKNLEKDDIKKVKMIANKAIDQEIRPFLIDNPE